MSGDTDQHISKGPHLQNEIAKEHRGEEKSPYQRPGLSYQLWLTLLLGGYSFHVWSYTFLNDDAYISFRYAAHWADYGEISYNLGDRVEGYTNFLWVAILAGCKALGANIPEASLWLSGWLGLCTVWLAGRLSFTHTFPQSTGSLYRLVTVWLLATSPSLACWSSGGLEVALFMFLLTSGAALSAYTWQHGYFKTGLAAGVLYGLTAMARPEGVLLFGIAGLYRLTSLIIERQRWAKADWGGLLGFIVIYLPYFVWRFYYYGYLLPNTYYAKTGADGFWGAGARYLFSWLIAQPWLILVIASPMLWFLLRPRDQYTDQQAASELKGKHLRWITLLSAAALCVHVARVGGDFMAMHRFLVLLLPLCAVSATPVLISLCGRIARKMTPIFSVAPQRMTFILMLITLLSLGPLAWKQHQNANRIGSHQGVDSIGWLRQFSQQCAQVGRFIARHTDPKAKLATTAAGALPYYAKRYTMDLLGLNDAWIAHHVPARGHRPGHTKLAPFHYPLERKVDYLIYHPTFAQRRPRPHTRYAKALAPWGYEWRTYQVPHLRPSWWGVWVMKSTEHLNLSAPVPESEVKHSHSTER